MANIMLFMQRKVIVEALMMKARDYPEIKLIYESNYPNASLAIASHHAKVALIEVAELNFYNVDYCLALCKKLREQAPECKLVLMCPEQDEKSVQQVVEAKGNKFIDDFIFYDVTMDYLLSKLRSL